MSINQTLFVYSAMRSKERLSPTVVQTVPPNETRLISNDSLQATWGGGPQTVNSGSEKIVYTVTTPSQRQRANFCRHLKLWQDYQGSVTSLPGKIYNVGAGVYYNYYSPHLVADDGYSAALAAAKSAFGVNLRDAVIGAGGQEFINEAARQLRPDLTTVSVPNFLIEITQIKSLFKLWKSNISTAKNVAGGHLNYSFGWKPTIGDLSSVVSSIRNLQQRIAEFEKSLNVLFHRQMVLFDETSTSAATLTSSPYPGWKTSYDARVKRQVSAHIVFRPAPLQALSNFNKNLRGLLDTLGFELNPRIIWDALPFTFVIDWFLNVGSFLDQFSFDSLELPIVYVDSYLQYKEELACTSFTEYVAVSPESGTAVAGRWTGGEKFFHRCPIFPDQTTIVGLGGSFPTLNQAVLGLSLLTVLTGKK